MSEPTILTVDEFDEKYADWWTPDYWKAAIEMQAIRVPGEVVDVYGVTARGRTRWYLMLVQAGSRR